MLREHRSLTAIGVFLFTLAIGAMGPSTALGQDFAIDRGSFVLGGTVSVTSNGGELFENTEGDRLNSVLLNPFAMFFVTKGFAIGGDLFMEKASQGEESVTTLGIGPSVAYFFGGPQSEVYPFIGAGVEYANLSSTGFDASGFGFNFGAGAAFMIATNVALTAQADYGVLNFSVDQLDESFSGDRFGLRAGISAFLF